MMFALEIQWKEEADNYSKERFPGEFVNRHFACASFNAAECEAYKQDNPTGRERSRRIIQLPVIDNVGGNGAATWHLIEATPAQASDRNDENGPYSYYIAHLPPGHDWLKNDDDNDEQNIVVMLDGGQKVLNVGYAFVPGANCGIDGLINGY